LKKTLDKFFYPRSVVLIGATEKPEKIGCAVLRNLLNSGFKGEMYPVNPKYTELAGHKCYKRVSDLPTVPDLAVLTTPAATIPDLIVACGQAGIQSALVLSTGFRESKTGPALFHRMQEQATAHGVRLIGPHGNGLMTPAIGLNATYASSMPPTGRLALISQSGALGTSILDWAAEKKVGFSHFVSVGDVADISFHHLIDYFGSDSRTACILIYVENIRSARKFMSAARAFARSKPIVVLRAGVSRDVVSASISPAGALAGRDAVYDAAFRRAGVIRVQTIQQLFDSAQALAMKPLPAGDRLAIVTNASGPAIIATDALIRLGGQLAELTPDTLSVLTPAMPAGWSGVNPVDVLADCTADQFRAAVRACLFDPQVDAVLVILAPQSATDTEAIARAVVAEAKTVYSKPVYASWMGLPSVRAGRAALESGRIPWYPFPERAVTTFMHMVRYRENLDLLHETPADQPIEFADIRRAEAQAIISQSRAGGRLILQDDDARQLLACYGIPVGQGGPGARELLIGAIKDPVFGPVIVFGLGGPDAVLWQDRAIGLPPLNLALARHLVDDTKVVRLLRGSGLPLEQVYDTLCRFTYLLMDFPELAECCINPFALSATGGMAQSAQVRLEAAPEVQRERFAHLCIQPYPTQWMKTVTLRDGTSVLFRPIRPEDEPMEAGLVHNTSRESLYFRFFGYLPGIDHKMLARFTHIDYDREMAIVAVVEEQGEAKIAGVVRIVGDGWRESCEYAILVADAWHGKGLGGLLTKYIIEIARAQGYQHITASFLKINGGMRRLFERYGFRIRAGEEESNYADLALGTAPT
jgi:acetyltransferase